MSPALADGIPIHGTTREALKEHFTREKKLKPGWTFPGACLCGLTHPCSYTGYSFLADTSHVPTGQGGSSEWYLPTFRMLPWVTPITEGPKWVSTPPPPLAPGKLRDLAGSGGHVTSACVSLQDDLALGSDSPNHSPVPLHEPQGVI